MSAARIAAAVSDPLTSLAARFFAANAESIALPDGASRAEDDARYQRWAAAADACYVVAPRTPAGAAALLDVILIREIDFIDEAVAEVLRMLRDGLASMVQS